MTSIVSNLYTSFSNAMRNANLSTAEKIARENQKQHLELVKVASIVATLATALFLYGIFPGAFTFALTATTAFLATEVYKMANNFLEILNDATVENRIRGNAKNFIQQVGKNTYLIDSFMKVGLTEIEIDHLRADL